jgi:hypothetical protein
VTQNVNRHENSPIPAPIFAISKAASSTTQIYSLLCVAPPPVAIRHLSLEWWLSLLGAALK